MIHVEVNPRIRERILMHASILFAQKGFHNVSLTDLTRAAETDADTVFSISPDKRMMWRKALEYSKNLFLDYFGRLDQMTSRAETFEEVLDAVFSTPKMIANRFTSYALTMMLSGPTPRQTADAGTFGEYGVAYFCDLYERCILEGLSPAFDTAGAAVITLHCIMLGFEAAARESVGQPVPHSPATMRASLEHFIRQSASL